jgi:hypothetical protein
LYTSRKPVVEDHPLKGAPLIGAALAPLGDWYAVRADAALVRDITGDALIGEAKVALGLREGGVENRMLDDDLLWHGYVVGRFQ